MSTLNTCNLIDVEPRAAFSDRVLRPLGRLARRIRLHSTLEGLCLIAAGAVGLMALQFAIDRLLRLERGPRAALHAKCVVVDDARALVTSANFTEAAQTRNIEAGALVHDAVFAQALRAQFEALVDAGELLRVPGFGGTVTAPIFTHER